MRAIAIAIFLLGSALISTGQAQTSDVSSHTRSFLDAYVGGDKKVVMGYIDEHTVAYGSDASEVFRGVAEISSMLTSDTQLWAGRARIGEMQDVSTQSVGHLHTIFFQAPFTIAGRPPVQVRFCMVWNSSSGKWHLLQSSNSQVTEGQSAKQLLERSQPK